MFVRIICWAQANNSIGDAGARALAEGFAFNDSLCGLGLVSCYVEHLCDLVFIIVLLVVTPLVQWNNMLSVQGVCNIVSRILYNHKLNTVSFDHSPSICVRSAAWQGALAEPPSEAVHDGWAAVLEFLKGKASHFS